MRAGFALLRRAITPRHLERTLRGRRLLAALDPVDQPGAVTPRLLTFERLLDRAPELRGEVVFLQAFQPGRSPGVRGLQGSLDEQIENLVTGINARYADEDWSPILHIRRPLTAEEADCLRSFADVQFVSPARMETDPAGAALAAPMAPEEIERSAEVLRGALAAAPAARPAAVSAPPPAGAPPAPAEAFAREIAALTAPQPGILRTPERPRREPAPPREPLTAPRPVSTVRP